MHRPDVLYLVHRLPYPPDKGDRIRAYHLLRFLAKTANVHLACLADEPMQPEQLQALAGLCKQVAVVRLRPSRWLRAAWSLARGRSITEGAFVSSRLYATVRDWCDNTLFKAVVASASSMVPYLRMRELKDVPAVVDLVDVDSQKWLDYAANRRGPRAWLYRTEGRRLRKLEKSLTKWTRAVTLVSEAEADIYRGFCEPGNVQAITNGVDLDYFQPRSETAVVPACVFVGALDYYPNIDAACWFCRDVWPVIHGRHPEVRLRLVGRNPAPAVRALSEIAGVDVVGQVPDVRPFVASAAVAVVPLRIARGLQNKVLEALALGKAVVASPQALAALKAEPDRDLMTASTPEQWVEVVCELLRDEQQRRRLGQSGRRFVEAEHSWDACLQPLLDLLPLGGKAQAALFSTR